MLDTCALLWLARSEPIAPAAEAAITEAGLASRLHVSAVSGWEVGVLSRKRGYDFDPSPQEWFDRALARSRFHLVPLTARQAIASSLLPDGLHDDPADRLLVATARDLGAALVTRDRRLLAYAAQGHLDVLPC